MTSASSTSNIWDELDGVLAAPDSPLLGPTVVLSQHRKRSAADAELESSDPEDSDVNSSLPTASGERNNKNLALVARKISTAKKLRNDQAQEMEDFTACSLSVQNVKLYGEVLAMRNKLDGIIRNPPPYQVSESLKTNIASYASGVFFSSKLSSYKGTVPRNHVLDILRRLRFDLPQGIEHNPADWRKVTGEVQEALTQLRSSVKKELIKSTQNADPKQHLGIFQLTQDILKGSDIKITIPIMSRIAVMRAVFQEHPGDKFWDQVDSRLGFVRSKARTAEQLTRAFKHFLVKDREAHGSEAQHSAEPEQINEETFDTLQQSIDDSIDAVIPFVQAAVASQELDPAGASSSTATAGN